MPVPREDMEPFTLTRDQVRELDRRAIDGFGVPGLVLMENAGRGCAELLMRLNPDRRPTVILCGPGNNGGDGFVIARHLDNQGWPVTVALFADPARITGDAAVNYHILRRSRLRIDILAEESTWARNGIVIDQDWWEGVGWAVDALFGTGLTRPLGTPFPRLFDTLRRAKWLSVLAVDIPSGLDCDTGQVLGAALPATHTATFVAQKPGFRQPAAQGYIGEVHVIDIGAPRVLVEEYRKGSG
jgi:NAD(P)H-hydrate epimerase